MTFQNARVLLRGLVYYSPMSIDRELYWRQGEIILTPDILGIIRRSTILAKFPYSIIYDVSLSEFGGQNIIKLRYLNVEKALDEIYFIGSRKFIENIYNLINNICANQLKIEYRPTSLDVKILYLLYKRIPIHMISYILDIDVKELIDRLNMLRSLRLIDPHGRVTKYGMRMLLSVAGNI